MDIIIWVAVGVLTIIMLLFMFSNSMSLQRFGLMEIFMIVLISVFFYVNMDKYSKIITEEYGRVAAAQIGGLYSYMSELENTSDMESLNSLYNELEGKLNDSLTGLDNTYGNRTYENAVLVQKKGNTYSVCSQIGINDNFAYGRMSEISALADTAFMNTKVRSMEVDGGTLYAVVDRGNIHAAYALVIEISSKASDDRIEEIKLTILIYSGVIFAAATLLAVLVTIIQHHEVRKMLKLAGAPSGPEEIGVSKARLRDTFRCIPFMRNRFTGIDLIYRAGLLDEVTEHIFGRGGKFEVGLNNAANLE